MRARMLPHQTISLLREAPVSLANETQSRPARPLTGRKVLAILIGFFGIVFGVNFYMAKVAYGTFRGQSTDAPYSEGIDYNRALEAARKQNALGWSVQLHLTPVVQGKAHVTLTQSDQAQAHDDTLTAQVHFMHPVDRARDHNVALSAQGKGVYAADVSLEKGHWGVELTLAHDKTIIFRSENQIDLTDADVH